MLEIQIPLALLRGRRERFQSALLSRRFQRRFFLYSERQRRSSCRASRLRRPLPLEILFAASDPRRRENARLLPVGAASRIAQCVAAADLPSIQVAQSKAPDASRAWWARWRESRR